MKYFIKGTLLTTNKEETREIKPKGKKKSIFKTAYFFAMKDCYLCDNKGNMLSDDEFIKVLNGIATDMEDFVPEWVSTDENKFDYINLTSQFPLTLYANAEKVDSLNNLYGSIGILCCQNTWANSFNQLQEGQEENPFL